MSFVNAQAGSRIIVFVGQILVLLICISNIELLYLTSYLPDKNANTNFLQTRCMVISKRLKVRGELIHTYRADFLLSYQVNGVQYNKWVSGNGLDRTYALDESLQEDTLSQFDVGRNYTCYYDPIDPSQVILLKRQKWISANLVITCLVAIMTLYFMGKTILFWLTSPQKKQKAKK